MSEEKKGEPKGVSIKIDEEKGLGAYANLFLCNFNQTEFVLDAVALMPGLPMGKLLHRSVMSPAVAKRLAIMLMEQVKQYEGKFGLQNPPVGPKVDTVLN